MRALRHTLPMHPGRSLPRRQTRLLGLSLACVLALSACSGADDDPVAESSPSSGSSSSSSSSSSASTPAKPYLPVPDGVELTAQGSALAVGDKAVVAFEPRQDQIGVLDIKVTRLERTTFKESFSGWDVDAATKKTNPYFVHATVENAGDTDLGGRSVPLYIVDGRNTLIEASVFASTFKPCPSKALPDKFKNGDRTKVCLVYLSPRNGKLTAVSFRPTEDFVPITWTGDLEKPKSGEPKSGEPKSKKKPKAKGNN